MHGLIARKAKCLSNWQSMSVVQGLLRSLSNGTRTVKIAVKHPSRKESRGDNCDYAVITGRVAAVTAPVCSHPRLFPALGLEPDYPPFRQCNHLACRTDIEGGCWRFSLGCFPFILVLFRSIVFVKDSLSVSVCLCLSLCSLLYAVSLVKVVQLHLLLLLLLLFIYLFISVIINYHWIHSAQLYRR